MGQTRLDDAVVPSNAQDESPSEDASRRCSCVETLQSSHPYAADGVMIDDSGAKGTSFRREGPEDIIRKSYTKFGLDASRLTSTHEPHTINPSALYMGSTAKTQSELTHGRSKKLRSARDDLLAYIPATGDSGGNQLNIDLVRRLAHSSTAEEVAPRLVDVVKALRRQSDVAANELNLFRCLEGLAVMVAKQHNEGEVRASIV
ncbi:hypothetical protein LTR74_018854 [Friedmanniomyces endolithicus]|nr:hypothetical protein LTR74_018854 [Friedmanniomyces endolithicus]